MARIRPKDLKSWLPATDRPRLLIVRLSALGDVLHALPVLSALRARFPAAEIGWAVEDRAVDLLNARTDLDRIHVLPRRRMRAALRRLPPRPVALARAAADFVRDLRAPGYHAALDLQGNLKSGAVTRVSGAALRMGFSRPAVREGNQVFNQLHVTPPAHRRHRVERNLDLASALVGEPLPYVPPGFPTRPEDAVAARALLATARLPRRDYVVLHPGASAFGSFKRWPAERFAALARRLAAEGRAVAVTHAPEDADTARAVVEASGGAARTLATPGLRVLAEVIGRAGIFVAADTGPLHLAGLLGTPLVGLYGPKDPAVYGPYGLPPGSVLTRDDVACRPCTLRRCADPLCMSTLAPEHVHARMRSQESSNARARVCP